MESSEVNSLSGVTIISAHLSPLCSAHGIEFPSEEDKQRGHFLNYTDSLPYQHECLWEAIRTGSMCRVRVLAPDEQFSRDVPANIEAIDTKECLHGSWPLHFCRSTGCLLPATKSVSNREFRRASALMNAAFVGKRIISAAFSSKSATSAKTAPSHALIEESSNCRSHRKNGRQSALQPTIPVPNECPFESADIAPVLVESDTGISASLKSRSSSSTTVWTKAEEIPGWYPFEY